MSTDTVGGGIKFRADCNVFNVHVAGLESECVRCSRPVSLVVARTVNGYGPYCRECTYVAGAPQ